MIEQEIKKHIQQAIQSFANTDIATASEKLLNTLGYKSTKKANVNLDSLKKRAVEKNLYDVSYALWDEWKTAKLIFQYSDDEVKKQSSLFDVGYNDTMQSYLFFAVESSGKEYSRSQISNITRFINRLYDIPVMLFFRYGNLLTVSIINRRLHKKDASKDVLEKVTQIKDINIASAHRAHIEILFDLSFDELKNKHQFANFEQLHNAWQETLDTKLLNKKFFEELSNWYFWAQGYVEFPNDKKLEEDKNIQINLIRLITRLIFVWFLKEKKLVNENLFEKSLVKKLLKGFDSEGEKSKTYYTAILQNLFFATLNQKMTERDFIAEGKYEDNKNQYGVKNLYRYADQFKSSKEDVINLFKDVPFLNGGLFDCLDKENEDTGKVEYIDGFSRNAKKVPVIPDLLFFGKERILDLSKGYGYKRNKEKCRGLLEIFSDYKFTIEENTPIEEEIALDPELLGKVFENLLAYYNPETETTARKQTGSYYTPREIVNYMVDESLIAYLKTQMLEDKPAWLQLGNLQSEVFGNEVRKGQLKSEHPLNKSRWKDRKEELENNLRKLIEYSNDEHSFTNEEDIQQLIYAIDHCKIIDPACGSGAFPMGILHKLVYVLGKLDDDNMRWRELQKRKAHIEIGKALNDTDKKERENKLIDINNSFEDNASDYGRKLYLIENCIYGVDIQPIAVQISKLRFFISLIVDQKEKKGENRGIRPLPNLETKFVAADTLIGLEKPAQLTMGYHLVEPLQDELQRVRHRHFEAKSRREKIKCQKEDKTIRKKIAEKLKSLGFGNKDADKIARFDIYDQNNSSDWFEPEWMFGKDLAKGFDIVIGNPPYKILTKNNTDLKQLEYFIKKYKSIQGSYSKNLFTLFIENAFGILSKNSTLSFIVPEGLFKTRSYSGCVDEIEKNGFVKSVVTFSDYVFENAVTGNLIFLFSKNQKGETIKYHFSESFELNETIQKDNSLIDKIEFETKPLKEIATVFKGMVVKDRDLVVSDNPKGKKNVFLLGKNISKWKIYSKFYTNYSELEIIGGTKKIEKHNHYPRILIRRTGDTLCCAYLTEKALTESTLYSCWSITEKISSKVILGLLNSRLLDYYNKELFITNQQGFPQILMTDLELMPIKIPNKYFQNHFSNVINYILLQKKENRDSSFFERIIDAMVYELYLEEAIQKANCEVLKHLNNLLELKEGEDERNWKTIEKVYKELSDPGHPVSAALLKLLNVEEVNIIEGRK